MNGILKNNSKWLKQKPVQPLEFVIQVMGSNHNIKGKPEKIII
jgi:hypothetical protein